MLDFFFKWMSKYYEREITQNDVIDFFHKNKEDDEYLIIELKFGSYSGQYQKISCEELCVRFEMYQLKKMK